jgi:V/A-type H+-transporting ATPase subunit F
LKKILVITPPDAEYGFGLAGVVHLTARRDEFRGVLEKAGDMADIGLTAIDERFLEDISEDEMRGIERKWRGMLVLLPAPELPGMEVEDYAMALIRRTIGYHLRLRL